MLTPLMNELNVIRKKIDDGNILNLFDLKTQALSTENLMIYNTHSKQIVYCNSFFRELFGMHESELPSNNYQIEKVVSEEDQHLMLDALNQLSKPDAPNVVNIVCRTGYKHLSQIYWNIHFKLLENNLYIIEFTRAAHILEQYKLMMRENEERFKYGIWESDLIKEKIYWSDGMYGLFGYDPAVDRDELKIDASLYLQHMSEEQFEKLTLRRNEILENQDEYNWEYEIYDKTGQLKIISSYAKLIRDDYNKPVKVVGTSRDITQMKEYERSLESKINALHRSNSELEEFAYVASHDMQEPLRKISTFGQRLHKRFANILGEDGLLYINRMLASTESMRKLIDNLLEFSRISVNATYEQVDLNAIMKEVLEELDMKIEESQVRIHTDPLPVVEAISSQMKQLFCNLIGNAIKFRNTNRQAEIYITNTLLSSKEIRDRNLLLHKKYALITIRDNGIGFDQQYAERIFQLFQRLQGKSEYPGTGMGLSISKKIIEKHNGLISAESEEGKGASFFVILPYTQ